MGQKKKNNKNMQKRVKIILNDDKRSHFPLIIEIIKSKNVSRLKCLDMKINNIF